jgi:hypothetical protein
MRSDNESRHEYRSYTHAAPNPTHKKGYDVMSANLPKGVCFVFLFLAAVLWAEADDERKFETKFSGYTYIEAGEVMKGMGYQDNVIYDHRWLSDACVGIFASTRIDEHLKVLMGFEGQLTSSFNAYYQEKLDYVPLRHPMNSFWVSQGEGIYTFGDPATISLEIEAGYFPYKYNQEVRNLGEYLFRTYCYPPIMLNLFDRTFTELMGVRVGNTLGGIFHHDLILHSETKQYPFYDASLSYLADVKNPEFSFVLPNFITLGGGIQLYRLIPVRGDLTTRHDNDDANLISRDTVSSYYDSATQSTKYIINEEWMSFAGTKVMGRATLDFKSLLPEVITDFLGKGDLKLYGEVAVLGWKNYPNFVKYPITYAKRFQRTPFTVGFNLPTFKIFRILNIDVLSNIIDIIDLDILNTEIEYLNTPYMNSTLKPIFSLVPLQDINTSLGHENLKWSVYAKKTIGKRMILSAQVANDHFIPKSGHPEPTIQDYHDVTLRHGDWWWNVRARFDF